MPILIKLQKYIDRLETDGLINARIACGLIPNKLWERKLMDAEGEYLVNAMGCTHLLHDPGMYSVKAPDFSLRINKHETNLDDHIDAAAREAIARYNKIWASYCAHAQPMPIDDVIQIVAQYKKALIVQQVANIRNRPGKHKYALPECKRRAQHRLRMTHNQFHWHEKEDADIMALIPVDAPLNEETMTAAAEAYLENVLKIKTSR